MKFKNYLEENTTDFIRSDLVVGTILYGSFGYDMTLPVFVQIVSRTRAKISVKELDYNVNGNKAKPMPNKFKDNKIYSTILNSSNENQESFFMKIDRNQTFFTCLGRKRKIL